MLDMQTRPSDLASLLKRLRQRQRVGQKELGDLAGLSRTLITNLERGADLDGRPPNPRPDTLRRLARGLSTDGEGTPHPEAEEAFYAELMAAAGYLPTVAPRFDARTYMRGVVPEADIDNFIAQYGRDDPSEQKSIADSWLEMIAEKRSGAPRPDDLPESTTMRRSRDRTA